MKQLYKMAYFREIFKKIELPYLVLLILAAVLPIQTRLVYFTPNSYIGNNFVFYNTLFLYGTDLLIVALVIFWLVGLGIGKFHVKPLRGWKDLDIIWLIWIFFIISGISIFVSHETLNLTYFLRENLLIIQFFGLFKLFLVILLFNFIVFYVSRETNDSKRLFPVKHEQISNNLNETRWYNKIFWLILGISLFEAIVGIWQYFSQKSIGLKLLGEEFIRPYLQGIAKFKMADGQLWLFDKIFNVSRETIFVMRPYGTFPHPNVFGAFMFFSSIVTYYLYYSVSRKTNTYQSNNKLSVSRETLWKTLLLIALFIQIFAVFISFSRVAIAAWLLATIIWFVLISFPGNKGLSERLFDMKQKIKRKAIQFLLAKTFRLFSLSPALIFNRSVSTDVIDQVDNNLLKKRQTLKMLAFSIIFSVVLIGGLFYPQFLERGGVVSYGTTNEEAVADRLLYQNIAVEIIKQKPLLGVGYQNFVLAMDDFSPKQLKPYQYQPVHNIYLLVGAETGLLGLSVFLMFIFLILKRGWQKRGDVLAATLLAIFAGFLFIGMFDHYLLAIQQGRLMFFLVAGLLAARRSTKG